MLAFGQQNETFAQHGFDDAHRGLAVRRTVGGAQIQASHETHAANGEFTFGAPQFGEFGQEEFAEFGGAFGKFLFADFFNLRESHGAADRVAEEGAGVNRFTARGRPGGIHHVRAADAGGERETASEGFAEANDVRHDAAVFAREPFSRATEAGVNFIEHEERFVFVAQAAEQGKKFGRRNIDAAAALDGFNEHRADPAALKVAAHEGLDDGQVGGFGGELDELGEFLELQAERAAKELAMRGV